jgi:hypothetical protein
MNLSASHIEFFTKSTEMPKDNANFQTNRINFHTSRINLPLSRRAGEGGTRRKAGGG